MDPSWSPDGRELAFKRVAPCCEPAIDQLWLMNADGTNVRLLSPIRGSGNALWNTVWSPDSKRLAFLAPGGVDQHFDVYVIHEEGTGQLNISNSPEDEMWPSWSPDGMRIAFARMSPAANNAGTLVVVDSDGSDQHLLNGPPINSNAPVWSPDGTKVLAYAKDPDPRFDENGAIAVFDPSARDETTTIPAPLFTSASWQRLAP
jgi:Tol biopolymer transport system component